MVQLYDPNEPERLEDIEPILPPRDRWPDQRLKRDAARSMHFGVGLLLYFGIGVAAIILFGVLAPLIDAIGLSDHPDAVDMLGFSIIGLYLFTLIGCTAYAYLACGWKRFPLTMLLIPAPLVVLIVGEMVL